VRGRSSSHPELETPAAEKVEHDDLFGEANRIVERHQINEGRKPNPLRALCGGGEKDARGRRRAQRRPVVLAHLVDVKAQAIVKLD